MGKRLIDNLVDELRTLGFARMILKYVEGLAACNIHVPTAAQRCLQAVGSEGRAINLLEFCETFGGLAASISYEGMAHSQSVRGPIGYCHVLMQGVRQLR